MVERLVAAGHDVTGTDLRPEARREVESAGARWVPDPSAAASSVEVLLTVLPGGPELERLVLGAGELLSSLADGALWIDLTSASVELGKECAQFASAQGIDCLDAPIGGGVPGMRAGTVTPISSSDRVSCCLT